MRVATMIAGAAAAVAMSPPAAAQDATPGETASYSQTLSNSDGVAFQPFDTSLGRLIGVHVLATANSRIGYHFVPAVPGTLATIAYFGTSGFLFAGNPFTVSGSALVPGSAFTTLMTGTLNLDFDPAPYAAGFRLFPDGQDTQLYASGSVALLAGIPAMLGSTTFTSSAAGTLVKDSGFCGASQGYALCSHVDATLTYTYVVGGVPEPATWTVMTIGFGAIGWAMRRRHDKVAAVKARARSVGTAAGTPALTWRMVDALGLEPRTR